MLSDVLIRNARVVPVTTPAPAVPVDVLIADGRVAEIGPRLDPSGRRETYDAEGRWLIPGLWDQHVHAGQWARTTTRLDLGAAGSPEEALAAVAERLRERPGEPVVGAGHRAGTWPRPVTVAELDAVAGPTPVVLINSDFHHAWMSTAALDLLGLPRRATVVRETEWYAASPRLDALKAEAATPAAYARMLRSAARLGVVGLVDFEFGVHHDDWAQRWDAGCDLLRVRCATYDLDAFRGGRTGDEIRPGLTLGSLKIISDGSLGSRTAWCCDPYADTGAHGAPNLTAADLEAALARAHAQGVTVATHAIGDRAVGIALDAYARTGAGGSIEHAQLIQREHAVRMAELGLIASVQPAHLLDDRDVADRVWPDAGERSFAFGWLRDAGVTLALGSDAPVAPLDPWLAIAAAVHRSGDEREPWHPAQALTVREALAASVDGQPTVGVGSRADLVLLDRDPLAATPAELRTMPVERTLVAGRPVE